MIAQRARSAYAAIQRHKQVMQQSLSCLSREVWQASESVLIISNGDPVTLTSSQLGTVYFRATQHFHTGLGTGRRRRDWKVYTDGYAYTISEDEDFRHELIAWHWHPRSRADTHVHIGKSHPTHGELAKYHLPSGRVSFEQVIRFLLTDLGVTPARSDWDAALRDSHDRFLSFRRWADYAAIPDDPAPV